MGLVLRKRLFAYAKTKTQISFAVTAKLISAFVFATRIVQSLYFLNPKFQVSSHLVWLYSPVCVEPVPKPRRPVFSERGSYQKPCYNRPCYKEVEMYFMFLSIFRYVINELIETEQDYVKDLGSIVEVCTDFIALTILDI